MIFHDFMIAMGGKLSGRQLDSATLSREGIEVFRGMLERHGESFCEPVPGVADYDLQWTREGQPRAPARKSFRHGAPTCRGSFCEPVPGVADYDLQWTREGLGTGVGVASLWHK